MLAINEEIRKHELHAAKYGIQRWKGGTNKKLKKNQSKKKQNCVKVSFASTDIMLSLIW